MTDAPPGTVAPSLAPSLVAAGSTPSTLLLCLSHLRWDFVFQRPQHLLTRAARTHRVVFFEEPIFRPGIAPRLELHPTPQGVTVAVPLLPEGMPPAEVSTAQRSLLDELLAAEAGRTLVTWFYTPMALEFAAHLQPDLTVYDCMDELSAFRGAPPRMLELERNLLARADLVFTGGRSLYEAKRGRHPRVSCFPSSIDTTHFAAARSDQEDPPDQAAIPHPRIGFFGVVDERMDAALVGALAAARPDWSFVMIGPVVKIDPAELPRLPNIHWLGGKQYAELPRYLAGWDAGFMPFARNESTRFISPTKTPEFLAAGLPVVSTPITDVVRDWGPRPSGEPGLVEIAEEPVAFAGALQQVLERPRAPWLKRVDRQLSKISWDRTWAEMDGQIETALRTATRPQASRASAVSGGSAMYDWLVVGAGFAGSVLAERLASLRNERVLVIDRRPHIGGNAYDHPDEAGLLIHRYGPHIFHTNSQQVFDYLSRFTAWRPYEHRVLAQVDGMLVPIPINLDTINRLYGLSLDESEVEEWLAARAEQVPQIRTSEDVVVSKVGRELYEKFFRGYTRKQWALDPSELDKSVTARVPTRTNRDDRYFTDSFQAMPAAGYTKMFERMLAHPNITVRTGVDYATIRNQVPHRRLIWSGPVDEYFGFRYGRLPYRSLRFEHRTLDQAQYQPVGTVNYPSEEVPHTRISEYKHLTGQVHPMTSITLEYPSAEGDPYYPIPRPENQALYKRYEALADATPDVWFVGRLATYRYYNMDQIVGQALATFQRIDASLPPEAANDSAALRRAAAGD